jgi:hypothetical protein
VGRNAMKSIVTSLTLCIHSLRRTSVQFQFYLLCTFTFVKLALREIGWDVMDWIDLAQDRDQWRALVNTVMNLRVP